MICYRRKHRNVSIPALYSRKNTLNVGDIFVKTKVAPFAAMIGCFFVGCSTATSEAQVQSNLSLRIMAANITSGNNQSYLDHGVRIFQGLKPDVVCIQEFNTTTNTIRGFVDTAFGTNFSYFRETQSGYDIPNGVISRWPIVASGSWDDTESPNRGYAWAQIDLPGTTNDLYAVSVHLLTANASTRSAEATELKGLIQANFPANAWIVVAGDMNTDTRTESAINIFTTFLSDNPKPADGDTPEKEGTNAGRSKPYDYVLPSFTLANFQTPSVVGTRTFAKGLVFDSGVYTPLSDVAPVQIGDSGAVNMQHMAVLKDFLIPASAANTNPPSITTQPLSQTNAFGGSATFSVAASGDSPLAYQWRLYSTNLSGATAASFTLTNIQPINAGDYTVVVTNSFGSITSSVAKLTVNAAPVITTQPQSLSVNLGANAAFSVSAAGGTPLFFQWRFGNTDISNATNSAYTRANAQQADAGNYSVVVSNYAGSVTSSVAVLTVNSSTPSIIAQWNFNSNPADTSANTGVTTPAIGTGTASVVGGITPSFVGGDTTADPAGSNDNTAWTTTSYPASTTGNKSAGVQFNVSTAGKQNIQVSWTVRASNTGSKYGRLQYSTDGVTFTDFPQSFINPIAFGGITNDLSAFPGVNDNPNFAFRLVTEFESTAINSGSAAYVGAGTSYGTGGTIRYDMMTISGAAIATGTAPVITNQPSSQAAAQGANATFTVGADGTLPLSYQWQFNLADISGATSASYTRSNVQPAHAGSYSVIVSNSAGFTTSSSATLSLLVPAPALTSPCAGVLHWQGLSNLTYKVQTSTNLTTTNWTTLGTATAPNGALSFTNAPTTDEQRYYRVVYP